MENWTPRRLFKTAEAARYLNLSAWSVRKLVAAGKLRKVPNGRGHLIDRRDLDDYIVGAKVRHKTKPKP
jgi:excisionase family DNA binding protein